MPVSPSFAGVDPSREDESYIEAERFLSLNPINCAVSPAMIRSRSQPFEAYSLKVGDDGSPSLNVTISMLATTLVMKWAFELTREWLG